MLEDPSNAALITVNGFSNVRELVDYAVQATKYLKRARKVAELTAVQNDALALDMQLRIMNPETEINMYRQGFISLMTIFDATVFDLTALAFDKDFFGILRGFIAAQGSEKMALEDVARHGSFEALRKSIIDSQLRGKYLKDLLFILPKLGAVCADTGSGHTLGHLVELVNRRNIHIHNRGWVDTGYLGIDASGKGKEQFNLFGFALGDVARIDATYWEYANYLARFCVNGVSTWVNTLGHADKVWVEK